MAKKNKEETALATKEETAVTGFEDLFDGFDESEIAELQEQTGLEETEEGRRPPYIGWNMEITTDDGEEINKKDFYNFQTSAVKDEVNCALLYVKKTRDYSYWDNDKDEKVVVCRSYDMENGQWMGGEDVVARKCETCPHRFSKQGEKKDCTTVMKIAAWDLEDEELFIFAAKRSSFVPMMNFLERKFFKQIKKGSKRYDIPLYMMHVKLKLKAEEGGGVRYYVLNPELVGRLQDKEQIMFFKSLAQEVADFRKENYEAGEKQQDEFQSNAAAPEGDDDVPF